MSTINNFRYELSIEDFMAEMQDGVFDNVPVLLVKERMDVV